MFLLMGPVRKRRLYDLIWKRTIASQMADAQIEKLLSISRSNQKKARVPLTYMFVANGEVVAFEGFLKVYHESTDDEENSEDYSHALPVMHEGEALERREITSTERYSQGPNRYTEASLVRKLEELGIGRHLHTLQPFRPYNSVNTCRREIERVKNVSMLLTHCWA